MLAQCIFVIPAKAGIQAFLKILDARLRGHDGRYLRMKEKKTPEIRF
jgi:hypothetical protein